MSTFTESEQAILIQWYDGTADNIDDDIDYKLYELLHDKMPYGVAKARTGDPKSWICDHLSGLPREDFVEFIEA